MRAIEDFVSHYVGTFKVVTIAACGAKPRFAAEINVVELIAMLANESRISIFAAIDEFFDIIDDSIAEFDTVFEHFGEVLCKNLTQNIHFSMIHKSRKKEKPP